MGAIFRYLSRSSQRWVPMAAYLTAGFLLIPKMGTYPGDPKDWVAGGLYSVNDFDTLSVRFCRARYQISIIENNMSVQTSHIHKIHNHSFTRLCPLFY